MGTIDQRVALVTGAAGGIGRAIAEELAAPGLDLYVETDDAHEGAAAHPRLRRTGALDDDPGKGRTLATPRPT